MVIYIGADHRGFKLKEHLKNFLKGKGYQVVDVGAATFEEDDDYPDFAEAVARKVSLDYENARGILICASGVGVDVVANKFRNVRSSLVLTPDQAFDSRNDDNANVLSLAAEYVKPEEAQKIVTVWLETPFAAEERFRRRLDKISRLELKVSHPVSEDDE
ncbi:MAG TPA: RpiB/LacA/LacB family sugar-phosphate isomerase [Candidatus Paceibacterota bacterium]|nr:RpiB/LacA/LacB family sugar-phosphate isomerase [Candidatus Paceibacterota bacterium]